MTTDRKKTMEKPLNEEIFCDFKEENLHEKICNGLRDKNCLVLKTRTVREKFEKSIALNIWIWHNL